ncbi:MAG: type I restriction endonuclease subunit R [Jatrophihabitans sp.]|uniref:type I restriction endonuclease subunit R n=1 Tax=Jatrophihabitans sp. TaxID=1932789 RepID=UPI003F802D9E
MDHLEKPFETELCEYLAARGWLYSPNGDGYDKARALFPEDIFGWLADTQLDELAKVVKPGASETAQRQAREQLLDRIVKVLDTPLDNGGGTLNLLRNGFKQVSARFSMCEFKPVTTNNATTVERYGKVRVRVMRQVFYSQSNKRSIDLVLFVNGLPVATAELKTDFTQSVQDAIAQYKATRRPKDEVTGKPEPLFGFGSRALVHFAVSNAEVWMTTKLAGDATHFLPFNMGNDGAAGNPPNPHGSASSYLWERVWQRDSWLNIIGKLMHLSTRTSIDPITGAKSTSTTLLFPRFHQWEAVTRLVDTARSEGPGHRYLIQHSAGSGKTNSISWLAHALATLHDEQNAKVFDSVIVVTDRTVLDSQLQDAIRQIESRTGIVGTVTSTEAARVFTAEGESKSKSALLAKMLTEGRLVIVVTLQTFPYAMEAIRNAKGLKGKRFAVIADEAHSSQSGSAANRLKSVLTAEELAAVKDGGEIDTEAVLAREATERAASSNISYFAFTATPKGKTLELFGRADGDGTPQPFHVYTMQQAIEEGYILDVLRNYTPYETAYQLTLKNGGPVNVKTGGRNGGGKGRTGDEVVDQGEAHKNLIRFVKLNRANIAQKVAIIVEHFRVNVAPLLDGKAKAMVVCDSRKAAVRYKNAFDRYLADHGYHGLSALVAFSGDDVPGMEPEDGPGPFNEHTLNPGLKGRDIAAAFATDEYRVLLVANKFQTGFDQPLLCAMYVDKQLSGVTAVQTLSRLNRTLPSAGKDTTYVLDFVNDPDEIRKAFLPYYRDAQLTAPSDPDLIHDLATKLDQSNIYTDAEVVAVSDAWVQGKGNNALAGAISAAKARFHDRWSHATATSDKPELEKLGMFRKDVDSFVRLYDFLSQLIDYGNTDLERRSIFFRLLGRQIASQNQSQPFDLSNVELAKIKQKKGDARDIALGDAKERPGLSGVTGVGSGTPRDPKMAKLAEVLQRLNDLFADEDFSAAEQQSWLEALLTVLLADETLVAQAAANSESQFVDSPDLTDAVNEVVMGNQTSHNKMTDRYYADTKTRATLVHMLGELVHVSAKQTAATSSGASSA